jgi:TatD DNase family protein
MGLIDSHCHLNDDYSPKTPADLVHEAQLAGVEALITIGTDLENISDIQAISETFPNVYHTIGIHPHETKSLSLRPENIEFLEKAAKHPKCRAIGEIGLDYYYQHSPKDVQMQQLELQLDLALRLQLPVVIHSRDGEADLLDCLSRYCSKINGNRSPGVIHCFTGTLEFGKKCLDLGFYISFSGILTFKKAEEVRNAAIAFPIERILVETDAPYLAPIPFRGKKCEPAMVKWTAEKLAELKHLPFEKICEATSENTKRVFNF